MAVTEAAVVVETMAEERAERKRGGEQQDRRESGSSNQEIREDEKSNERGERTAAKEEGWSQVWWQGKAQLGAGWRRKTPEEGGPSVAKGG